MFSFSILSRYREVSVKLLHREGMRSDLRQGFLDALAIVLRPVARFCIRRNLSLRDMTELAKVVFVEVAAEEISKSTEKVNVSRISLCTGMHRQDVKRIFRDGEKKDYSPGYITRVMGQWQQDEAYLNPSGKPRILEYEGENSEFNQLVRKVTGDVHPGTVLFQLERLGAVEKTAKGLKLRGFVYVPKADPIEGFKLFAKDTFHLLSAVDENILGSQKIPNLHIRTEFDNIAKSDLPKIRKWIAKEGSRFHQKIRKFVSKFDLDINKRKNAEGGGRFVLGSFSRCVGTEDEMLNLPEVEED